MSKNNITLDKKATDYLKDKIGGGQGGSTVIANPEGEATEDLNKLQVEDTIYGIPQGTEVVANPELSGDEEDLTGLQVGDTKYKVPEGGGSTPLIVSDITSLTNTQCNELNVGDKVIRSSSWDEAERLYTVVYKYSDDTKMILQNIASSEDYDAINCIDNVIYENDGESWHYTKTQKIDLNSYTLGTPITAGAKISNKHLNVDKFLELCTKYNINLSTSTNLKIGHVFDGNTSSWFLDMGANGSDEHVNVLGVGLIQNYNYYNNLYDELVNNKTDIENNSIGFYGIWQTYKNSATVVIESYIDNSNIGYQVPVLVPENEIFECFTY